MAALAGLYAIAIGFTLALTSGHTDLEWIADWCALPSQFAALTLGICLLWPRATPIARDGAAWVWVLAFTALSPAATYIWNTSSRTSGREVLSGPDLVYLADYWLLTIAFAIWFVRAGGSFRARRTWLDGFTMAAVLLVALWSFFLGPAEATGTSQGITFAATFGYSVTIVCMMSMAALLCLQMPAFRHSVPILLVIGAGVIDVAWEIMWMASWLTDRDYVGPFYNFGDVLCFTGICTSIAITQSESDRPPAPADPARRLDSFLPVLAVLMAIALVAGFVATTRAVEAWILVSLAALCALLLLTRERSARAEVRALNGQLARRQADARLTELVRCSADLILVVDVDGLITFASPATAELLGIAPEALNKTPAIDLFGAEHRATLQELMAQSLDRPGVPVIAELRVQRDANKPRACQLVAVNQRANQLINGFVLTVTDVSEQRLLEREVLDAASRERIRLAGEIHDGLGQQLVGIAMLLQGVANAKNQDTQALRQEVRSAVGQINQVVGAARDLARGLSPIGVVRGSLGNALGRLATHRGTPPELRIDIDPSFEDGGIDDFCADHLHRIAQEAVSNAVRHGGCAHIEISLCRVGTDIQLEIADDGRGFGVLAPEHPGIGLRLMQYRARIIGATLHVQHEPGEGTRVSVTVPAAAS